MKTVLVTGALGFLGHAVCTALMDGGWKVCRAGRQVPNTDDDCFQMDLAYPEKWLATLNNMQFDAIVHLGTQVGWIDNPTEAQMYAPNILATGCLAELCQRWGAHLVFSSAAVVHGLRTQMIKENSILRPDSSYAKTKLLAEQLIEAANPKHTILRIGGIFGHPGPAHLGLNRAIAEALQGERPTLTGSGEALRNYIYVKDAAQAIVCALEEKITGTHLLAGHESLSISSMLKAVYDVFLPGQTLVFKPGAEGSDQLIESSNALPRGRSFREALHDIQREQATQCV